jgi:hypothetical protein
MNSRENVLTTIEHKEPDRVPLFFNAIDARFVRAIGQGDMVETWKRLGVNTSTMSGKTWCEGKSSGMGYSPDPPPAEESLGGTIFAGWNGIDEFGRRWEHGLKQTGLKHRVKAIVGGAPVTERFAREIGVDGYASDAASAVDVVKSMVAE